jgi:1,4-dihydroxy-2-naphthoate octaprenyltransferase
VENLSEGPIFKDLAFIFQVKSFNDICDYKRGIDFSSAQTGLSFNSRLFGQQSDVKKPIAIPQQ